MNDSFWGWLIGAVAISVALLFFLGAPAVIEGISVGESVDYTESVMPLHPLTAVEPITAPLVSQHSQHPCDCARPLPELVGGCREWSSPCTGTVPCAPLSSSCGPCSLPGINRSVSPCIPECGVIQLHATVAQPVCDRITFRWEASKGTFLDPTVSDPLFYIPATYYPTGEDLWITLTIIDQDGRRYSDRVCLHVVNVR
jgi:hypothetical protein